MKSNKCITYIKLLLFVILPIRCIHLTAQPPEPEEGIRWILNEPFSDEFNDTVLDRSKWYDYHPWWIGRPPAIFLPSQVSVSNGCLVLRNKKLEHDTIAGGNTYSIAGGAVVSKSLSAFYGYYECSMKASRIRMSSTFWMSGTGAPGPDPCAGDRYSLELDIQEAVGGYQDKWQYSMNSNSHYNYTNCEGVKTNYSAGNTIPGDRALSDTFFVYGAHWIDASKAKFYFNGKYGGTVNFRTDITQNPFDRPMHMNMVTETYDWVRPLPTEEDLADPSINATYYDWVRSYIKVPVDKVTEEPGIVLNGGFENGDFSYWTGWGGNPREVVSNNQYSGNYCTHVVGPGAPEYEVSLKPNTTYTLSCYGKVVSGMITLGIKDTDNKYYGTVEFTGPEYEKKSFDFTTGSATSLKFYYYAQGSGDEGYADDFDLVEKGTGGGETKKETLMFGEKLQFSETPRVKMASRTIDFLITYMANADREINLRLINPVGITVGAEKYTALAGYGKKRFLMHLDSVPSAGNDYTLVADIRPPDSSYADTFQTARYSFDLLNPVRVSLSILDARDDSPVTGASVTIGDSTKISDSEGNAEFFSISPGTMPIRIDKDGFVAYASDETAVRSDTSLSIRLTPVSHLLTIYVLNAYTGEPVKNASISLDGRTTLTDFEGKSIRLIYAGTYVSEISHERYAGRSVTLDIARDTAVDIALHQVLADVKFVILLDSANHMGATVTIDGRSEVTSPVGLTVFPGLKTDTAYEYSVEFLSGFLAEDTVVFHSDTILWLYFNTPVFSGPAQWNDLRILPNPASTHIRIVGLEDFCEYQVNDIAGRVLLSGRVQDDSLIDVSHLPEGIYFLKPGGSAVLVFILDR